MRSYLFFLPLACLFLGREIFTGIPLRAKIVINKVLDGDTLELRGGERLRLAAIDAPELGQPTALGGLDAGKLATQCLRQIIQSQKEWRLSYLGRDLYGRILGDLSSEDIASLNERLVYEGCCSLYAWAEGDQRKIWRLREEAQRERRGLWKYGGFMRPSVWRKKRAHIRRPLKGGKNLLKGQAKTSG
jgi:endonuclease YncB( thermonuclease family)